MGRLVGQKEAGKGSSEVSPSHVSHRDFGIYICNTDYTSKC